MAFKVPVVQSKCGCCPSCEASAASLRDVVVGADIFIGAAEAVMALCTRAISSVIKTMPLTRQLT